MHRAWRSHRTPQVSNISTDSRATPPVVKPCSRASSPLLTELRECRLHTCVWDVVRTEASRLHHAPLALRPVLTVRRLELCPCHVANPLIAAPCKYAKQRIDRARTAEFQLMPTYGWSCGWASRLSAHVNGWQWRAHRGCCRARGVVPHHRLAVTLAAPLCRTMHQIHTDQGMCGGGDAHRRRRPRCGGRRMVRPKARLAPSQRAARVKVIPTTLSCRTAKVPPPTSALPLGALSSSQGARASSRPYCCSSGSSAPWSGARRARQRSDRTCSPRGTSGCARASCCPSRAAASPSASAPQSLVLRLESRGAPSRAKVGAASCGEKPGRGSGIRSVGRGRPVCRRDHGLLAQI
eukprot:SAG11_NODE_66_length_18786_cov_13.533255_6_plen_351_part_00